MDELHQKKLMRFFVFARLSSEIGVTDRFRVTKTNIFDGSFYHNRTNRFAASPAVRFEYDRMCRVVLVRSPPYRNQGMVTIVVIQKSLLDSRIFNTLPELFHTPELGLVRPLVHDPQKP